MIYDKSSGEEKKIQIRWLVRKDMLKVLEIEGESFEYAWTEDDFLCCLRQRNCIGMVAEYDHDVNGFMVYELLKSKLHILNFAVASNARRQGFGTYMISKLVNKLSRQKRHEIVTEVRESNLDAQLFFKQQGFRAYSVLRGYYDYTSEEAYVMKFRLGIDDFRDRIIPVNRISKYDVA